METASRRKRDRKCVCGSIFAFRLNKVEQQTAGSVSTTLQWCVREGGFLTETRKECLKELAQSGAERRVVARLSTVADNRSQPLHHTVEAMSSRSFPPLHSGCSMLFFSAALEVLF